MEPETAQKTRQTWHYGRETNNAPVVALMARGVFFERIDKHRFGGLVMFRGSIQFANPMAVNG